MWRFLEGKSRGGFGVTAHAEPWCNLDLANVR
nr:MAG TPA: hypothetical protein [Caudoviricetes sp.]